MTVGELAQRVKAGEPGAMLELWEAVRRFVKIKASDYAQRGTVPLDDLLQAGFLAMIDAAERYDPEREQANFLSVLSYTLKTWFAKEAGIKTSRRDALQYADSLDAPAVAWDENSAPVVDTVPDSGAALAFMDVEYVDFLNYCRQVIRGGLDTLPAKYAALLRMHYLKGRSLKDTARLCGLSCAQAAGDTAVRALLRLERGKYRRELRECLEAFKDFREYQEAAEYETWKRTGISRTEAAALVKTGMG